MALYPNLFCEDNADPDVAKLQQHPSPVDTAGRHFGQKSRQQRRNLISAPKNIPSKLTLSLELLVRIQEVPLFLSRSFELGADTANSFR